MFLRQTTAKTMRGIVEDDLEQATLGLLEGLGYSVVHGRGIAPGETATAALARWTTKSKSTGA